MGLFGSRKPKAQDAQSPFQQVGLQDIPPPPGGGGLGLVAQKPLSQEKFWGQAHPPPSFQPQQPASLPGMRMADAAAVKAAVQQPVFGQPVQQPMLAPQQMAPAARQQQFAAAELPSLRTLSQQPPESASDFSDLNLDESPAEEPKLGEDFSLGFEAEDASPSLGLSLFADEAADEELLRRPAPAARQQQQPPQQPPLSYRPQQPLAPTMSRGRNLPQGKPVFVGVNPYVSVLDALKDVKKASKEMEIATHATDTVRQGLLKTANEWHDSLDEMHRRLAFIDRILFEGERE